MTFNECLRSARERLAETETPYLDALVLLSHATGVGKERLLANLNEEIPRVTAAIYDELLQRRLAGEPVSYIRNRKEFWGLDFYVDKRVLVPRPDTEVMVEEALRLIDRSSSPLKIHDACTGSGCIAVALKHERPEIEISVSDISEQALEVADFNARSLLGAPLASCVSDLLADLSERYDLITCNPPYVEHAYVEGLLAKSWPEPILALDGGKEGYDLIPRILSQGLDRLESNGYLMIEASPQLVPRITDDMDSCGYTAVRRIEDLAGRPRIALGRKGNA